MYDVLAHYNHPFVVAAVYCMVVATILYLFAALIMFVNSVVYLGIFVML